ncbi:MAG: aminoglycoside 6'-N-acetyltransferase [Pseudomonadota bacterium]
MNVRVATSGDLQVWVRLRGALWNDTSDKRHAVEAEDILAASPDSAIAFLAFTATGEPCGFAEATMRSDHVNGCDSSPVAFLEGIYVQPEHRAALIGQALLDAVEAWARAQGSAELGSDADIDNLASHGFHIATGFEETQRTVFFRKRL